MGPDLSCGSCHMDISADPKSLVAKSILFWSDRMVMALSDLLKAAGYASVVLFSISLLPSRLE